MSAEQLCIPANDVESVPSHAVGQCLSLSGLIMCGYFALSTSHGQSFRTVGSSFSSQTSTLSRANVQPESKHRWACWSCLFDSAAQAACPRKGHIRSVNGEPSKFLLGNVLSQLVVYTVTVSCVFLSIDVFTSCTNVISFCPAQLASRRAASQVAASTRMYQRKE